MRHLVNQMREIQRWYSDAEDYNKIIDIFNKKKGQLFLFNVMIQNHGGYLRTRTLRKRSRLGEGK